LESRGLMAITLIQAQKAFRGLAAQYPKAVVAAMRAGLLLAHKSAVTEYIVTRSGPPLPDKLTKRTGRLSASVRMIEPKHKGREFVGGIMAGRSSVAYAAIHERGGRTGPHIIRPKRAKCLHWIDKTGAHRFARYVKHPGSRIPARPYLMPSLRKNVPQIEKQIAIAIEVLARRLLKGH